LVYKILNLDVKKIEALIEKLMIEESKLQEIKIGGKN
jgi:hypothetical protein